MPDAITRKSLTKNTLENPANTLSILLFGKELMGRIASYDNKG
jgi:hypothetical protein